MKPPIGGLLQNLKKITLSFLLSLIFFSSVLGEGAVITLVMPVGARQLGMGETAVAIADDAFATFWNPAGLAFGPLSDEWELALSNKKKDSLTYDFTSLGAKQKRGFLSKTIIWSGAKDGLLRFNGKVWKEYFEYVLEQDEKISTVLESYLGTKDSLKSAVQFIKQFNNIKTLEDEEELISLKIPYNLLFKKQEITALVVDKNQRLWVGTPIGLFRFDGAKWKSYQEDDVFKNKPNASHVTSLALKGSEVWIGTKNGLFRYRKTKFIQRGKNLLASQYITSIATHSNSKEVYVAMKDKGVARYTPAADKNSKAKWKIYNVIDGLLDSTVNNLVLDSYGHLWVGHVSGISHFSLVDWQRITFNKQHVTSLDLSNDGSLWIGTNKGVWKHTPAYATAKGRRRAKKSPSQQGGGLSTNKRKGDWFHYHTGNALADNNDLVIKTDNDDVWFVTQAGVERYNAAKSQMGLFYESLLPALGIDDLFHVFAGGTTPLQEWGTVGGFINFISFGDIPITTSDEEEDNLTFSSSELVATLSYGTKLSKKTGFGLNIKFIYSALAPERSATGEEQNGVATGYAIDLGFLWKDVSIKGLSFGLVLQNIGPAVAYVDQNQRDPIPFTWKVGTSYEVFSTPNHKLIIAGDANREAVFREEAEGGAQPVYIGAWKDLIYPFGVDNGKQRNHSVSEVWNENIRKMVFNSGTEYTYANVMAFRAGYLLDQSGERNELDLGLGFALSDILQIDASFIRDFGGGIRNGQKRFSLVFKF